MYYSIILYSRHSAGGAVALEAAVALQEAGRPLYIYIYIYIYMIVLLIVIMMIIIISFVIIVITMCMFMYTIVILCVCIYYILVITIYTRFSHAMICWVGRPPAMVLLLDAVPWPANKRPEDNMNIKN